MTAHIQSNQSITWQDSLPAPGKAPWRFRALGKGINLFGRVAPEKAGRLANRLWFTPTRGGAGARYEYLLERPDTFTQLRFGAYDLPVFSWGAGPAVLFVHGWSGAGIQFGAMVEPLVRAGYRVVVFDAPGHGRAQGSRTDVFEIARVVREVAGIFGRVHGLVAHSVGSVAAVLAVAEGLAVDRLGLIAPPASLASVVRSFGAGLGLSQPVLDVHARLLEERFGKDVWQRLDLTRRVGQIGVPGLIISDRHDRQVPVQEGQSLAVHWPEARFLETRKLGHNRILESEQALAALVAF
ncbi:MAG: alpha/beta hydrolase, partial [Marinobacter sp.]|uniref:alpha/beta hydrolase n=1 Tax=Marinobacter sp. TaxID=50741 RepID=UPI00299E235C